MQFTFGGLSEVYCWADPQLEHGDDCLMVHPALSPSHGSSDVNISQVRASDNDVIYEVPVLGTSIQEVLYLFFS